MDILCFASAKKTMKRIRAAIMEAGIATTTAELADMAELHAGLSRPRTADSLFILCPKNKGEFQSLLLMGHLLAGTRVILVLPRLDKNSVRQAYGMLPCFLSFTHEDFSHITMVLKKISCSRSAQRSVPKKPGPAQCRRRSG